MDEMKRELDDLRSQLELLHATGNATTNNAATNQRAPMRLPRFARNNPHLWFAQIERLFRLHNIDDDTDKFDLITVHIDEEIIIAVEDLVLRPPATDKYLAIKNRLLEKFAESAESKFRRLLHGDGASGSKPSEILANMRRLASDPASESLIRTLFLAEMPQSIRPMLTVWEETNLDKLAKIADKMIQAVESKSLYSMEPNNAICSVTPNDSTSDVIESIRLLNVKFENLQKELKQFRSPKHDAQSRSRSASSGRPQWSNSSPKKTEEQQSKLCFYHLKFGDDAKKCRSPCVHFQSSN
ncbi:uncharacterized protein [Drosophila tropicalis]|uniref:uncharacterized protein n=1 Tax=Drosophila tropicalis TaxID=46794 RepID=UPI0035AB9AB5